MAMEFPCRLELDGETPQIWTGNLAILSHSESHLEVNIWGRGSAFHVIAGPQVNGHYACIPNWDIGSELAGYKDFDWNYERLCRSLGKVDAITVATALTYFPEIIGSLNETKSNNT